MMMILRSLKQHHQQFASSTTSKFLTTSLTATKSSTSIVVSTHQSNKLSYRCFTQSKPIFADNSNETNNNEFRVAIIGAGASGMSTALHLSPLVQKGLITHPIDIYETSTPNDIHPHETSTTTAYDEHFHPGSGHIGRKVGIGIWSTALSPFCERDSSSSGCSNDNKRHLELIHDLESKGQYVGKVGYRTPSGKWLTKGQLNTDPLLDQNGQIIPHDANKKDDNSDNDPALLFIREKDFLSSLRTAIQKEEHEYGTIKTHYDTKVKDVSLSKNGNDAHCGYLTLSSGSTRSSNDNDNSSSNERTSSNPYHLIISAEGIHSSFRTKYAGYTKKWKQKTGVTEALTEEWKDLVLEEIHGIEDRKYTVFRGNSPLSDVESHMDGLSFQTWGEGKSMRFAAVGMSHPHTDDDDDDDGDKNNNENTGSSTRNNHHDGEIRKRDEEQVWFATICDSEIIGIKNAEERKQVLLNTFKEWHDPVGSLIESTPANEIIMERGVAHKHAVYPVFNLSQMIHYRRQKTDIDTFNDDGGPGPILLFTGDAAMTVDPVLAQGFTIAMEAAADLAKTLESSLAEDNQDLSSSSFRYNPNTLKAALTDRNNRRYERMLCLLRATELVQTISQPSDSFSGFLSNKVVRPVMMLVPSFLKEAIFSYMIKYSLGLYGSRSLYNQSHCDMTKAAKISTSSRR